jgi:hypothetical protein
VAAWADPMARRRAVLITASGQLSGRLRAVLAAVVYPYGPGRRRAARLWGHGRCRSDQTAGLSSGPGRCTGRRTGFLVRGASASTAKRSRPAGCDGITG